MTQPKRENLAPKPGLLNGWISRFDLAQELGLSVDTLGRWGRRRKVPACVRAGRKVLYRISAVQDWLQSQEMPRVGTAQPVRDRRRA